MIEAHFGESTPFSIGVEEEIMILDAATFEPVAGVGVLLRGIEGKTLPGSLKTELHASVVELTTGICATVGDAVAALAELRAAADSVARANGLRIAAAGAHPTAALDTLPVVQEERYTEMIRVVGYPARRQGVCGLHVHVGMPSGDRCYAALEALLPWLPVVLALSANSPFLEGEATGMWSNRPGVLAELPRSGAPPAFGSYTGWEAWVERLSGVGLLPDYTRLWWDVRPHPRLGTLEVRMPDQPTSIERTALLVGLIRELVETAPVREPDPGRRGDYAQNRWAAARFGLDAELIHPEGDHSATARELAAELLGEEPPEPEAAQQLEVGVTSAAADLAERTVG
ncbi:MAG: YbdK family carboxylate-amine ligase [Gaiellaceae bacterium]